MGCETRLELKRRMRRELKLKVKVKERKGISSCQLEDLMDVDREHARSRKDFEYEIIFWLRYGIILVWATVRKVPVSTRRRPFRRRRVFSQFQGLVLILPFFGRFCDTRYFPTSASILLWADRCLSLPFHIFVNFGAFWLPINSVSLYLTNLGTLP